MECFDFLIISFLIYSFLSLDFVFDRSCIYYINYNAKYNIVNFQILFFLFAHPTKLENICWIFDKNVTYQVLISFCSIIKNNPDKSFNYYFIIPPTSTIDVSKFNHFLPLGSNIIVKHFEPKHAYLPIFSNMSCDWSGIVIVKIWLSEILPEVNKILYLDSDIVNANPISPLWNISLEKKTFGGAKRVHWKGNKWINSGAIFYNLQFIRTQPHSLFECANKKNCFIDDNWHTHCHKEKHKVYIPYRYNAEFTSFFTEKKSEYHKNEEKNVVFYHLKDVAKEFYTITNRSQISHMKLIRENKDVLDAVEKIYSIKEWVDLDLKKMKNNEL